MTDEGEARYLVTPRVLVFFDYACQFCYLDWPRFTRLRHEHEVELFLVPFELRPEMPAEGLPISSVGGHHSERVQEHMHRLAEEGGLELVFPDFVPNTHAALSLGEFARDLGPEAHEAVHEALFSAYSGRGLDIGSTEVVLDVARDLALDADEVAVALAEGRFDERLHQFYHLGLQIGITGTPAALICNQLLIGTRPYEVLQAALDGCLLTEADLVEHDDGEPAAAVADDSGHEGEPATIDR